MIYWIVAIIILNVFVLLQTGAPPFVKLNAAMVSFIALFALIRIWRKKRQRKMERLFDEVNQLQRENEELRMKVEKTGAD